MFAALLNIFTLEGMKTLLNLCSVQDTKGRLTSGRYF